MKSQDLIKELRSSSSDELQRRVDRLCLELARLSLKKSVKRLENVALLRNHKKEIARIFTVLTERQAAS